MRVFQCDMCSKEVDEPSELVDFGKVAMWPSAAKVEGWEGTDLCKGCAEAVWADIHKLHDAHMRTLGESVRVYLAQRRAEIRHGA